MDCTPATECEIIKSVLPFEMFFRGTAARGIFTRMIKEKSYTRITLALDIIRRMEQGAYAGYHELGIIKHQIGLYDVITVKTSPTMGISCNSPLVPVDSGNICWKAAEKIRELFGIRENVHITIEKNIPVKGGLAGGSANAATVIRMLDTLWSLRMSDQQLCAAGREVGMDVPYYFTGKTAFDTEATGILEPVATKLHFDFLLIIPDFGVATAEAYKGIAYHETGLQKEQTGRMREAFIADDRGGVIRFMHNDFEKSVFRHYPELARLKKNFIDAGCLNVVMSGSGSTLVGVARDADHAQWIKKNSAEKCGVVLSSSYTG